ncbi:MAG: YitT family protein [Ruminococcus sp.]|nr:YitT family protein [Ruminococcus sp.]MDE6785403.1 YitT family protein [Ruminococcus sp.]
MNKKELFKRYILFIVSLFISAMGVALTKHGELGVSPISSVSNVLSMKFTAFSLGTWLIIWNCALIAGQIIVLRKKFQLIQLLQIPLSFLFGWFTDLCLAMIQGIPADSYIIRIILVFAGIIVLGFGISLSVIANVIMNSGEAFVKAVSDISGKQFGNVKIVFDVFCVMLSVVLSMLFFNFRIVGTREGTVISALLTGFVVKLFTKFIKEPVNKILS